MAIKVIGWTSYDNEFYPVAELYSKEVRDAIVEDIRANGYEFNGLDHQYHKSCTPVLNNGKRVCCSQRQWGGLMAYAHNVDDWDGNAYLFYFLTDVENPCYPLDKVNNDAINSGVIVPQKAKCEIPYAPEHDEFEFRKFRLQNFSARLFNEESHQYHMLIDDFDGNAALVATLLIKIADKSNNECFAKKCVDCIKQIMMCWITEDGLSMKDSRLSHLETKFESGRVAIPLSSYCPSNLVISYSKFKDDLFPCLYFLINNCPNSVEIRERLSIHLHNLFEFSVLYQVESINIDVPQNIYVQAKELLKSAANE